MKIVNITPGLLPIPPKGWGAVEKIIWEYHCNLLSLGHQSYIKYLDEIKPGEYDIVHVHVANLAIECHRRGIPYFFTMHDHHAYLYGNLSHVFNQNLEAIENSIKSFLPAKYLVNYFGSNKAEYFSHGVNNEFFHYLNMTSENSHSLLCVANNGYIHSNSSDRKGFKYAIEAAKRLDLPITIAGPKNNKNYFKNNKPNYDKLEILYDLDEEQLRDLYQEHTIFLHPSELEAGHPNLTLLEAMACGLPVVGTFEDGNRLDGMIVVKRDVDKITGAIKSIILNYFDFQDEALAQAETLSWKNVTKQLLKKYMNSKVMKEKLMDNYKNTPLVIKPIKKEVNKISINFINKAFIEITGTEDNQYFIQFVNQSTGKVEYELNMGTNCWAACSIAYFVDWKVVIEDKTNNTVNSYVLDLRSKRVFIAMESKAIGDTLAWFPYVDEFRKKHNCNIICSTFHNNLFKEVYPEIELVEPGDIVHDLTAMYSIGWFYTEQQDVDKFKHPREFKDQPLQKTASDILGLEFRELIPRYSTRKYKTWSVLKDNFNKSEKIPHTIDKVFLERDSAGFTLEKYQHGKFGSSNLVYAENFEWKNSYRGNIYEDQYCVIEEGDVVVDIGANIGCFANFASKVQAGRIYAYEPASLTFECLELNKPGNCTTFNQVVSKSNERRKLYLDTTSDVGNSIFQHGNTDTYFDYVQSISLEEIVKSIRHINFLKIDAEGAEKEIFDSTPNHIFAHIDKIAFEFHNNLGDAYKLSLKIKLVELGYRINVKNENKDTCIFHCWKNNFFNNDVHFPFKDYPFSKVSIAINGTAQAKYWNNPTGWQEVVDYLTKPKHGDEHIQDVVLLSQEEDGYMGNRYPTGITQLPKGPLSKVIEELENSRLFIGIGSGLSWLSWMVGTPTVLISGFSEGYTEPETNVFKLNAPEGKCHGCFNTHRLDPGDWNWCPIYKGTDKQFECSKLITSEKVIKVIDDILFS